MRCSHLPVFIHGRCYLYHFGTRQELHGNEQQFHRYPGGTRGEYLPFCRRCGRRIRGGYDGERIVTTGTGAKSRASREQFFHLQSIYQTPYAYMLNTNTMKFHRPGCHSIQKMAEDNILPSNQSREEIIAKGYEPCQICKP